MIIRRFVSVALVGIILSFSLLLYLIAKKETSLLTKSAEEKASLYASSITAAIKNSMVQGVPAIAHDIVDGLNEKGTMKISLYKADGSYIFGYKGAGIPPGALSDQRETIVKQDKAFLFINPLLNEPACYPCHPHAERVLGVAVINMPLDTVVADIRDSQRNLIVFGVLLVLFAGIAVFLVAKKCLLDPLAQIHEGVERIKKGDLSHRIDMRKNDEFGSLAATFNQMTERIEKSHANLESAVRQKTKELSVIAELSTEVFKGNLSLTVIIEQFLNAIVDRMGFGYAALCLVDKESGMLFPEFKKGIDSPFCAMDISLATGHPFARIIREARPSVRKAADIGAPDGHPYVAMIPLLSHQRKRCREVIFCAHEDCPAFNSAEERCWLISDTLCRSPQAVPGQEKIYGCLHCLAFPVLGVLIAGRGSEVTKSSLHSLEILSSALASAIENQRFIESKKRDINDLIRLHDISVESLQNPGDSLTRAIISSVVAFSGIDAAMLWLRGGDGRLSLEQASIAEKDFLPASLPPDDPFIGRAIAEERPIETVKMEGIGTLEAVAAQNGFMYAAAVPLKFKNTVFGCLTTFKKKDFYMTDSEKAIMLLFASQAAAAMNTNQIYRELKLEKEFSDAVFNNMNMGIMVLDNEGRIVKLNPSGFEITGIDSSCVGKRLKEVLPEASIFLVLDQSPTRETYIPRDGVPTAVGFGNSAILDMNEEQNGTVVVFRDLTEIKRLQAELRKKEHFESMGKVISGVAHEVRNPLFGISSIGQILARELDSQQHKSLIQAMLKETDRLKRLIEELLMYTRPSRLDIREIDLGILLEEVYQYIRAKNEEIRISSNVPPYLFIRADRDKITQVFLNVLSNAIDAARSAIAVSARMVNEGVEVTVADDGTGIKSEDLNRVFDPFFTTKKGGTGLGLPICRKIIEDHGNTIDILSSPGTGTVVKLFFKNGRPLNQTR